MAARHDAGETHRRLTDKLSQVPGYVPGFLHPIEGRLLMLSTGIRAQVGVKIFGDNLDALQQKAFEVERVMREIPGAAGVAASRMQGKPYLNIELNRAAMAITACARRTCSMLSNPGWAAKMSPPPLPGANGFHPGPAGARRTRRIERLGDVLVSTPAGNSFNSVRWQRVGATSGRAKSTAKTAGCGSSYRPTCQGRDLGSFVKERSAHRAGNQAGAGHDHRMERPVRTSFAPGGRCGLSCRRCWSSSSCCSTSSITP